MAPIIRIFFKSLFYFFAVGTLLSVASSFANDKEKEEENIAIEKEQSLSNVQKGGLLAILIVMLLVVLLLSGVRWNEVNDKIEQSSMSRIRLVDAYVSSSEEEESSSSGCML